MALEGLALDETSLSAPCPRAQGASHKAGQKVCGTGGLEGALGNAVLWSSHSCGRLHEIKSLTVQCVTNKTRQKVGGEKNWEVHMHCLLV